MTDPRPIRCAECGNVIGHRDNRDAAHALFIEHLASDHPDQLARVVDAFVQSERKPWATEESKMFGVVQKRERKVLKRLSR